MTELVVKLPDELAQRARSAGSLTDSAIPRLLDEAMQREAGRRLLQMYTIVANRAGTSSRCTLVFQTGPSRIGR